MTLTKLFPLALFTALLALPATRAGILEDRAIEDAVNNSYIVQHVLTDRSMLQLYVRNGAVELRGQMADENERALVGYLLDAIPHVVSVKNNVFVDSATRRSTERWRALRARSHALTQQAFDGADTKVSFTNGRWEIVGTVADEAERARLEASMQAFSPDAPVPTELRLGETPAAAPRRVRRIDDPSVVALLRSALGNLPSAQFTTGQLRSLSGAVELHGTVAHPAELAEVTQRASRVPGVTAVVNRMTVRP